MGIYKAFSGAIIGTLADQWRDIITVDPFDETTAVKPGIRVDTNNGRGSNTNYSEGVITNGSKIYVPENTAAVIFDSSGIEGIITEAGGYEYHGGERSVLSRDSFWESIGQVINERFDFGGQPATYKKIIFLNLREIRNIKFGTHGPVVYHDKFYDADLEVLAHGMFSVQIIKPVTFIQNYLPVNTEFYDFNEKKANMQLLSDISQSMLTVLNKFSAKYRISDILAHAEDIFETLKYDDINIRLWPEKYGIELSAVSILNIEFSKDSRDLVNSYNANKMNVNSYDNISKRSSDIAFRQKIAQGVQEHGFGDGAGAIVALNMMQNLMQENDKQLSIHEQIETVKKLKELLDIGAISEDEFEIKKKEVLGL